MAEDSRRAPRGAALSKNNQTAPRPLDLRSWQGLTEVLQRGREAGLSDSAYAEFRDLVLQYAQRGGDPVLLKEIETIVSRFPAPGTDTPTDQKPPAPAPTVSNQPAPAKSSGGFFTSRAQRPTPTFLPLHVGSYPEMPLVEAISAPAPAAPTPTPAVTQPPSTLSPAPIEPPAPEPVTPAPAATVAPQAFAVPPAAMVPPAVEPETPSPTPAPVAEAVSTSRAPSTTSAPVPVAAPLVTPPAAGFKTLEEHKTRIAEIKRLVNTKVGNPATLMDPNNAAGREYMAALLGAMKASAGGGAPLDNAMQALEAAHLVILSGLPTESTTPAQAVPPSPDTTTPSPAPEPPATPIPPAEPVPLPPTPPVTPKPIPIPVPPKPVVAVAPEQKPAPVTKPSIPNPAPTPQTKPEPIPLPPKSTTATVAEPIPVPSTPTKARQSPVKAKETLVPSAPAPEPEVAPMPRVPFVDLPANLPPLPIKDLDDIEHSVEVGFVPPPEKVEWEKSSVLMVQEAKQNPDVAGWVEPGSSATAFASATDPSAPPALGMAALDPTLTDVTTTPPEEMSVRQADLTSPEVTVALNQLLSEWSIFASSGLFGIGPGGAEHPLYRRLAVLTMGEVLAGRWEKATPELRHTISDYVNAWRHEQAVAYNPSETFEHYLRRVVYRILKRQRG